MVMIEQCKCDNHLEALKKERHYMELLKASLNLIKPTMQRTKTQEEIDIAYQDAIEKIKQHMRGKQINPQNQLNYIKQMIFKIKSKYGGKMKKRNL